MAEDKSVFQKIGDAVVNFAPTISGLLLATGVGAPAAAAVSAVGALGRSFGLGDSAKPEDVLKAVTTDPDIRLKAMIAENDHIARMRAYEIEELRIQLADVNSARDREIQVTKATGKRDWNLILLGWVIVVGYMFLMSFLAYHAAHGNPVKDETGILFLMVGNLLTFVGTVIGYWYGTTKNSQMKTEMLAKAQPIK